MLDLVLSTDARVCARVRAPQFSELLRLFFSELFFVVILGLQPNPPLNAAERALIVSAFMVGGDLLLIAATWVRKVVIDDQGVVFVFMFHKDSVNWAALGPAPTQPTKTGWAVRRVVGDKRAYRLTLPQARAIVRQPAARAWDLPPETVRGVEL